MKITQSPCRLLHAGVMSAVLSSRVCLCAVFAWVPSKYTTLSHKTFSLGATILTGLLPDEYLESAAKSTTINNNLVPGVTSST